jgi:hypothetical protein
LKDGTIWSSSGVASLKQVTLLSVCRYATVFTSIGSVVVFWQPGTVTDTLNL